MTRHPIILSPEIARCPSTRTVACSLSGECALALVEPKNRSVQDYSFFPRGPGGRCKHYIPADTCRIRPPPPGPKVHEAL